MFAYYIFLYWFENCKVSPCFVLSLTKASHAEGFYNYSQLIWPPKAQLRHFDGGLPLELVNYLITVSILI